MEGSTTPKTSANTRFREVWGVVLARGRPNIRKMGISFSFLFLPFGNSKGRKRKAKDLL
jgi:hypothetical protein